MKQAVKDHSAVLKAFRAEAATGRNGDLRAYAARTVPTVKTHLEMAKMEAQRLAAK
jgi:hypothetical protein